MTQKPGRNDPCPCGSGKKFKKCCGLNESPAPLLLESERTGTPYDDYMEIFALLMMYGQKILRFEDDGRELKKAMSGFEKRFRPGDPGGLTDSFFMSWMHFDLRFGTSFETIAERVLRDPLTAKLVEPGPTLIRRLAESYLTFYEIIKATPEAIIVKELGTEKRYTVLHVWDLYEIDSVPGEIWFSRLIGPPDKALFYTTPYIYDPETKARFMRAVRIQEKDFSRGPLASRFPPERHFAESQKKAALFWAEFIHQGMEIDRPEPEGKDSDVLDPGALPFMLNTDGEEIVFVEMHFRVRDEPAIRKKLAALRSFEYDEKDGSWTWLKAGNRKDPEAPRTVLGSFRIKDGRLIAETNSQERAARFRFKLKSLFGDFLAYEKTLYREQDDIPESTREEIEAQERESAKLNARPEVQEALRKYQEHYYFKQWPKTKIPALDGRTPLQAAKTKDGRRQLKDLLDDFERQQDSDAFPRPRIDFDALRRILGLPPKAN